jgi:hypothetical protein
LKGHGTIMNRTNLNQKVTLNQRLRKSSQRQRRRHDPWLLLNMSAFNFERGWNRVFNPVRQNAW